MNTPSTHYLEVNYADTWREGRDVFQYQARRGSTLTKCKWNVVEMLKCRLFSALQASLYGNKNEFAFTIHSVEHIRRIFDF